MKLSVQVNINANRERIWEVISDIKNAVNVVSAIELIEVLEEPDSGILGLKWRETRTMFGKTATEVMWITEVQDGRSYSTRAESHGSIYKTRHEISGVDGDAVLGMEFIGEAQTLGAKILSATMGSLFKGATVKALQQDLDDIKAASEQ